jgi:hypothetical protein
MRGMASVMLPYNFCYMVQLELIPVGPWYMYISALNYNLLFTDGTMLTQNKNMKTDILLDNFMVDLKNKAVFNNLYVGYTS